MNFKQITGLAVAGLLAGQFLFAQTIDPGYEVAKWKGFTEAAVTYTFDDNCTKQYSVAIPMFNEFSFNATFYPVANWGPQWAKFNAAALLGHEIGSHTMSHTNMSGMDTTTQDTELKNSKIQIEANITGQKGLTIAYPYCVPSNPIITRRYYFAARHCQGQVEKTTPADFYNISSIICGESGSVKTTANFIARNESAASIKGWCVYLIHGIDGDGGYSSLNSGILRESLEYLDANRQKYWVATFGNAVRYIRERNSVSVAETASGDTSVQVEVSDTLDNEIYNYPVSIRRTLPQGWEGATVVQDQQTVPSRVVDRGGELFVEFDIVPDAGTVLITKSEKILSGPAGKYNDIRIHPNPFTSGIQINAEGVFNYRVFTSTGKQVCRGTADGAEVIGANFSPGIYFLNVLNANHAVTQKIVKL